MVAISPHRRPHYTPAAGLAIAELKAARAWCLEQTARVFHVTAPTIASWVGRLDGRGPDGLVQMRTPVNRYRGVDMVGRPGDPIIFEIGCFNGRRHLPIIRAQRAA